MRLIIDVDDEQQLARVVRALEAEGLIERPASVATSSTAAPPPPDARRRILEDLYARHQIKLPEDWRWDREAANERNA